MIFTSIIFSNGYYLTESSRNDSFCLVTFVTTHHCMSLTTTCLTICKYRSVVAVENVVD